MSAMAPKNVKRLDTLLFEKGLAPSRARAQSLILAGLVYSGDRKLEKAGLLVDVSADIEVRGKEHPYVSRGGVKLAAALDAFQIDPAGMAALDVGASTGGFTDCLLQRGAKSVFALDVGKGQIDWKLRSDPRVTVVEEFNARTVSPETVAGGPFDIVVMDVSFISLELILPPMPAMTAKGGYILALVKPQFEAGRAEVGKGGIVKDPKVHKKTVGKILALGDSLGLATIGQIESPITGAKGNKEFFIGFKK